MPAGAEIQPAKGRTTDPIECEGPHGVGFSGQVFVEYWYEIIHPVSWPADQTIETLDRYWKTRGYRGVRDSRDNPTIAALYVKDRGRATEIGAKLYPRPDGTTDVYLVGISECVWEHGTSPSGD